MTCGRVVPIGAVYPRVCGGTKLPRQVPAADAGLSPRVRGNRESGGVPSSAAGSIPACAGEPAEIEGDDYGQRVYPRVCGGTDLTSSRCAPIIGLSPRVRGNRVAVGGGLSHRRSIPACAGEPGGRPQGSSWRRVYPRVCGGTYPHIMITHDLPGLSPRVRGNRHSGVTIAGWYGSIPACAGEPGEANLTNRGLKVYPRVCGGTDGTTPTNPREYGLSPRVRGNRFAGSPGLCHERSIPACAGEPTASGVQSTPARVYPRVCGGTGFRQNPPIYRKGLSPRVRGNPAMELTLDNGTGSIPACAGEPA